MNKINCNVANCSHNKSNVCYSNRINVAGIGAKQEKDTCCGSFLDESTYGKLTNNTNNEAYGNLSNDTSEECFTLVCTVQNCTHNCNSVCELDSITVNCNTPVKVYSETYCNNFEDK